MLIKRETKMTASGKPVCCETYSNVLVMKAKNVQEDWIYERETFDNNSDPVQVLTYKVLDRLGAFWMERGMYEQDVWVQLVEWIANDIDRDVVKVYIKKKGSTYIQNGTGAFIAIPGDKEPRVISNKHYGKE